MIVFKPAERITANAALQTAFVEPYHDHNDEPEASQLIELAYDDRTKFQPQEWKQIILSAITSSWCQNMLRSCLTCLQASWSTAFARVRFVCSRWPSSGTRLQRVFGQQASLTTELGHLCI